MNRADVARKIAEKMLDEDLLDIHNFAGDTNVLLKCVQNVILDGLQDYLIISGVIL